MYYLGIDVGSSFIKGACLLAEAGTLDRVRRRPFPAPVGECRAGHFEIDAELVTSRVRELIDELVEERPRECEGVFFCAQMGGVLLASRDGQAMSPYYSWRDQRTAERDSSEDASCLQRLLTRVNADTLHAIGNEVRAGSASALLFWLAERGALPAQAMPLTLGDYVIARICGCLPQTEYTQALGTLDLNTRDWCWPLFEQLGLAELHWPRLTATVQPVGELRIGARSVPCSAAVGDHQAALAGVELQTDELSINISTGSQVSRLTERFEPGNYQTRPYLDVRYLNTMTHLPAGRSLDVLLKLVTEVARETGTAEESESLESDAWSYLANAADRASDSELRVKLTFFPGPLGERGSIEGISTDNFSVGSLFRAAFSSMAENYAICAERLRGDRGWQRLAYSGGLAQKLPLLRAMIGERLPGPCRTCDVQEDTLMGLLHLARHRRG
jgi:sugar (pentulose or hexulose) kinase